MWVYRSATGACAAHGRGSPRGSKPQGASGRQACSARAPRGPTLCGGSCAAGACNSLAYRAIFRTTGDTAAGRRCPVGCGSPAFSTSRTHIRDPWFTTRDPGLSGLWHVAVARLVGAAGAAGFSPAGVLGEGGFDRTCLRLGLLRESTCTPRWVCLKCCRLCRIRLSAARAGRLEPVFGVCSAVPLPTAPSNILYKSPALAADSWSYALPEGPLSARSQH